MPSVLFMGVGPQDPDLTLPPNLTAQELDAAINKGASDMREAGYTVNLFLPHLREGIARLEEDLKTNRYDLVLVGVSLGLRMDYLLC
jgi:hypothetical protein